MNAVSIPAEYVAEVGRVLRIPWHVAAAVVDHAWPLEGAEIVAQFGDRIEWLLPPIEGPTKAKLLQALRHLRGG